MKLEQKDRKIFSMTIKEILDQPISKENRDRVIQLIQDDSKNIHELMNGFFSQNIRINQKAAWSVGVLGEKKPELISPYLPKMIKHLEMPFHDAIVRNTLRVLQFMEIPEELEGNVYDYCFNALNDPKVAVAIRVFSMTVLANLAMKYPELKEELIKTIELFYPYGSAGFKSRSKKEMKRLSS